MTVRVLTVSESDSIGARGIQADIKTITALGGYATNAVSSLMAQDTRWVEEMHISDPKFVAKQMRMVIESIGVDAIKLGILASEGIIHAVCDVLEEYHHLDLPIVVDPAIISRHGDVYLDDSAIAALKRRIFFHTTVLTPNLQEAEKLSGRKIKDIDDMREVAEMLRSIGIDNVVLKAGQVMSKKILYFVATPDEERIYEHDFVKTNSTIGAGCTLASAIATSLAQGLDVFSAIEKGLEFMNAAIKTATDFGLEYGPVNHAFDAEKSEFFFCGKHPEKS